VLNTGEILGGYNPVAWHEHASTLLIINSPWPLKVQTSESFIFSLNEDSLDESIVSFVIDSRQAVYEHQNSYPRFGDGTDLHFGDGTDLHFGGEKRNPYSKKSSYQIAIRSTTDAFKWLDWEIFSVIEMN